MAAADNALKCLVTILILSSCECFNSFSILPHKSSGSVGLCLRRSGMGGSRSKNQLRQSFPLRSNLMGGSDDSNPQERKEADMPLVFYRSDNGTRNSEFWDEGAEKQIDNQFFQMISTLAPGEMVGQFIKTASPRVQVI